MKPIKISNWNKKRGKRWGFTLIELIVVMAVIAILVLLAAPKFLGYTQKAKETQLKHNVKVLEKRIDEYLLSHESLPIGWEPVPSQEMNSHLEKKELFDINGVVKEIETGEYLKIPDDFIAGVANLSVTQTYLSNEKGKVYSLVESKIEENVETGVEPEIPAEPEVVVAPPAPVGLNPLTEGYVFDILTNTITGYTGTKMDIVIPKSFLIDGQTYEVLNIGPNAFINKGLTKLVLSNNLINVGNEAFKGNPFTDGVILDANLTKTGSKWNGIFEGVALGDRVQITENVTKIPSHMFMDAAITNIEFPDSITRIESLAFCGAQLKSISLSGFITFIGDEAFYGNPFSEGVVFGANLANAVSGSYPIFNNAKIGDGLTITTTLTKIQANTFKNSNLSKVEIPLNITEIGNSAFENNKLTEFKIPTNVNIIGTRMLADNLIATFDIPKHITAIPTGFLIGNPLKTLTIPSHVTSVGNEAFGYNSVLESLILDANLTYAGNSGWPMLLNSPIGNNLTITSRVTSIPAYAFKESGLTSVTIPTSVTSIGASAFEKNKLTELNIPTSVTTIGARMLADNLFEKFDTPQHITTIPTGFLIGNPIKTLIIPSHVTSVGNEAFGYNSVLESVILDTNLTYAGNSGWPMLLNSPIGNNLTITSRVTSIPAYAFKDSGLTSVTIPTSITTIGTSAFEKNKLTELIIPTSVTSVGTRMLANNLLAKFDIPQHITTIPTGFLIGNPLTTLTIPSQVTSVGNEAFGYISSLESVTLEANLTYAGDTNWPMFLNSSIKNGLTVTSNVTKIPAFAFKNAGLTSVRIPSTVNNIEKYAFDYNKIPQGDAVIENLAANITFGVGVFNNNTSTGTVPIVPVYQN